MYWLRIVCVATIIGSCAAREWAPEPPAWARETQFGAAKITALDVICGKEHMTVRAEFNAPFQGIIFSKGTYGQDNCVYIKPYSSITHATFNVKYDECGTKPDLQGKYYENTIVIQYGTDIIEAWDEAKRLRCEWFEAYEKPATFRPAIPVADLDVIEMNFQGDEIDCWMSIQEGKGPWAREVSRIVPVGQPMTIVIAINDFKNQFDMRVKSCFAHDGVKPAIHLTDEYGCVLRPKMLSPFKKIRDSKGKATLISYAQFLAFKFPDSMDVQIQCTVEVCRHGCSEACQVGGPNQSNNPSVQVSAGIPYASRDQISSHSEISSPNIPEDEPQPVYQDISSSNQPQIIPPNQMNGDINSYNIDVKNVDINHSEFHDQTHQSPDDYQAIASEPKPEITKNFESYNEEMVQNESENKPVLKMPEIQVNNKDLNIDNNKFKITNLADLNIANLNVANLKPEDFDVANKILANQGINKGNLDFNNLAATFAQGLQQKDIISLIQNNNIKDLVSKFTNRIEQSPVAAALSSNQDKDSLISKRENKTENPHISETEPTLINTHFTEQSEPNINSLHNSLTPESEHQLNAHKARPQFNNLPQINLNSDDSGNSRPNNHHQFNRKTAPNSFQKPPIVSGPVAQVLNVPLQPGLPFLQVLPNRPINMMSPQKPLFQHLHQIHQNHQKQLFPHMALSLNPNNHFIKNLVDKRKEFPHEMPSIKMNANIASQSQFPFGPRSLRIRRSDKSQNEIGLKKGFQVVTSVDLAFFPNITTDSAPIYEGRRANIVYGVCLPVAQLATGLSCILWLIVVAFSSCACMIYKLDRYKKSTLSGN